MNIVWCHFVWKTFKMKVSYLILTVFCIVHETVRGDITNRPENDHTILKRSPRERRRVLGVFSNSILKSPNLKEQFDEARNRFQPFAQSLNEQKLSDNAAKLNFGGLVQVLQNLNKKPNVEAESDEGMNINAPESIKDQAGNPDQGIQPFSSTEKIPDEPESYMRDLISPVYEEADVEHPHTISSLLSIQEVEEPIDSFLPSKVEHIKETKSEKVVSHAMSLVYDSLEWFSRRFPTLSRVILLTVYFIIRLSVPFL
nr:uncharacterized protein LOC111504916 [Leptinotarsa decemlineata]